MSGAGGPTPYDRPEARWVCGRAPFGRACADGPDLRGRCTAQAECRPRRHGGGWQCTRIASLGGACEDGPLPDGRCCRARAPCQPLPSARGRRVAAVRFTAALCVAGLALLTGPWGAEVISPGPLAAAHGTVVEGCAGCHAVARTAPDGWLGTGLGHPAVPEQAELCLACHDLGPAGRLPHGLEPAVLARRTETIAAATASRPLLAGLVPPPHDGGGVACATCHREHRGRDASLTTISDGRCQACHQVGFTSLADGHPDFSAWPSPGDGRIAFDHGRHEREYFADESEPFRCSRCHEPDGRGVSMRTASFERGCASCHDGLLRGRNLRPGSRGVAFLGVPELADALRPPSGRLAAWPEGPGLRRSAFVALLLAGDPSLSDSDLAAAGADASGLAEPGADPEAAARVLEAWLGLLDALAERGAEALRERVAAAAGREVGEEEAAALAGGLPRETLLEALAAWLPASAAAAQAEPAAPDPGRERFVASGGWYRQDTDRSLRYRPSGHADPFLRAWIELAARLASDSATPGARRAAPALLRDLTRPASPGQCALCHRLGEDAPRGGPLLWAPPPESSAEHPATRFAHRPHLSLQDQAGCGTCHRAAREPDDLDEGAADASSFVAMTRPLCASCHRPGSASDRCTTCHLYHRESFAPGFDDSGLRSAPEAEREGGPAAPRAAPSEPQGPSPEEPAGGESGDELLEDG